MEYYLLKSSICLCVLYGFYKVVLERDSMHTTKRYYLLGGLIAGLGIPLITFTKYITPAVTTELLSSSVILSPLAANEPVQTNLLPGILWAIYLAGVLFFAGRFVVNLVRLVKKIHQNPHIKEYSYLYVLLRNAVVPHTFFSYIFLNKKHYKNAAIPPEVIAHEKAHAKQKHSLDILLIELIQIVFWFNPLVYKIKSSIKLNHEFLADKAVLDAGFKTADYQTILLSYAAPNQTPALANAIHYSSIKKRFTVMKTQTSKTTIWLKSMLLLPLGLALLYGFSATKEVPIKDLSAVEYPAQLTADLENSAIEFAENAHPITPDNEVVKTGKPIKISINGKKITVNGKETSLKKFTKTINDLTKGWSKEDYANTDLHIELSNVDKDFIKKVNDAYKQTALFKADPNGHGLVPPPPPPPPLAPNGEKVIFEIKNNKVIREDVKGNVFVIKGENSENEEEIEIIEVKETNSDGKNVWVIEEEIEDVKVIDSKGGNTFVYLKSPNSEVEDIETQLPPPPPPPPAPEDPVDHLIKLAKEGAIFKLNGNTISSDRAIELVKQDKIKTIDVVKKNNATPVVHIKD